MSAKIWEFCDVPLCMPIWGTGQCIWVEKSFSACLPVRPALGDVISFNLSECGVSHEDLKELFSIPKSCSLRVQEVCYQAKPYVGLHGEKVPEFTGYIGLINTNMALLPTALNMSVAEEAFKTATLMFEKRLRFNKLDLDLSHYLRKIDMEYWCGKGYVGTSPNKFWFERDKNHQLTENGLTAYSTAGSVYLAHLRSQ